jgi:hypothetical protein
MARLTGGSVAEPITRVTHLVRLLLLPQLPACQQAVEHPGLRRGTAIRAPLTAIQGRYTMWF